MHSITKSRTEKVGTVERHLPPNQLAEYVNILLDFSYLGRLRSVEQGEGRGGGAVIDVTPARLEETANEKNFKE